MEKRTPFDIKYRSEIESGKYLVETRDGRPVRILCWDKKDYYHYPVTALVQDMGYEVIGTYSEEGKYDYDERESTLDLFLVANPDYKEPVAEQEWIDGDEDEKIRKFIAETVFRYYGDSQEYLDTIAYLKRQKAQTLIPKFKVGDCIYDKRDSYNRSVIREVGKDYYINGFAQKMDMAYTDANFEFLEHLEKTENLDTAMLTYAAEVFSGKTLLEDISYSYREEMAGYFNDLVKTAKENKK